MSDELVLKYQNFIYKIMQEFSGYQNKEDLYQVGWMGLIKANKNFDESFGIKFSTYAYKYIKGEMSKLVREDKLIKYNRELTKLNLKIEKAKILLTQKLMREPSNIELSTYLKIPIKEVETAIKSREPVQSLEYVISTDEKDVMLEDVVQDKKIDMLELLNFKEALTKLNEFEKQILNYSLINKLTQTEIANMLGMTQVQVSRSLTKVKEKVKTLIGT